MATVEEKQKALNETVAGLGTAKFEAPTVSVAKIIASPEAYILIDTRSKVSQMNSCIHACLCQERGQIIRCLRKFNEKFTKPSLYTSYTKCRACNRGRIRLLSSSHS